MFTIGQRLKAEREARYLSIEKAAEETRIRMIFLRALEADDYSVMPSAAQGRGFLRNYAKYLDINIDEVIAEMQRNAPSQEELSGPLSQVNFLETEVPSLTESQSEEEASLSWITRIRSAAETWLAGPKQAESPPEENSVEPISNQETIPNEIQAESIQTKQTARRKKKVVEEPIIVESIPSIETTDEREVEATTMPIEIEQAEAEPEAQTSLLAKLLSLIPIRITKAEAGTSSDEVEETIIEEKQPAKPTLPAGVIFAQIGRQLRERRELISLTPEEVERHIKLRLVFVKALEEGAFDKLPSTVQTRGMLANYSTFLDMDTDKILLQYADALQARRREKYAETPREKIQTEVKASIPLLRSFIAGDLVFGIVMIAVLLALGVWGISYVISSQADSNAQPTPAPIVNVLVNAPQTTPSPAASPSSGDPALTTNAIGQGIETPTLSLNANVVVSISSVERAFVRIAVDDNVVFEGRIAPFDTKQYEAENKIEILCGNAAALRITYNGRDLGLMGNVGEVVNRVYTISGIVAPTSTPPPTATNTPLVTNTPTSTATITATPTADTPSP